MELETMYETLKYEMENNYTEITDILFNYIESYINQKWFDVGLFADECENITGLRNHDEILELIKKLY